MTDCKRCEELEDPCEEHIGVPPAPKITKYKLIKKEHFDELKAENIRLREALECFAKPPYKDSDLKSLVDYYNSYSKAILTNPGYTKKLAERIKVLEEVAEAAWNFAVEPGIGHCTNLLVDNAEFRALNDALKNLRSWKND